MATTIRRVAVLGAGIMGSGIAAHLANAGIESLLYDIVPGDAGDDPAARNAQALKGIEVAKKMKPAAFFRGADASLITACNYDDHGAELATCDWVVEVVVERLDIKQKVFAWVAEHAREDAIVSSNTSGIPLAAMAQGMAEGLRRRFLITHFFNPVRYMRLLELVVGPDTDPEIAAAMADFGERVLGKGVVWAKDTPAFVANRVGTFGMGSVFEAMAEGGFTVEQVDAIFGKPMGRPKSAVFRTADVVGIDTLAHVMGGLHRGLPEDERRQTFAVPKMVDRLIADGRLGAKSGAGFYKKVRQGGKSVILGLDTETLEYRAGEKVRFECMGKARKEDEPGKSIAAMVYGDDAASALAWRATADTLIYAANRIPEIADDVVNIDRGLRWGFAWDLGPFETWDAIGVRRSVERMQEEGREVPAWVLEMLAAGRETFYARDESGTEGYWQHSGGAAVVARSDGHIILDDVRAKGGEIERNLSASLLDLGDGVLCLEFHSKLNALDDMIIGAYSSALDRLDSGEYKALVVGNQDGKAFCAGANIMMILMGAMQGQWAQMEEQIKRLQDLMMRAKYAASPVVTAPYALTLGGGAEVAMHSAATRASGELYMGLVEVGVGLIPAAGGCKEMVMRAVGDVPQDIAYDAGPFVQKVFERIGLGKVTSSAEEARAWGFLRPTDALTLDPDRLIGDAKKLALGMANGGYVAPRRRTAKLPGPSGRTAIELFLYQMSEGGFATEHDVVVGRKLAHVLCGGDIPAGTVRTEQDLLDLEREAFLSLAGTEKSKARMQHMLQKGKPLRN